MKVVINTEMPGIRLSDKAADMLCDRGLPDLKWCDEKSIRTDPRLIEVVGILGKYATRNQDVLAVIDIPFDTLDGWHVRKSDWCGETVCENHRSWSESGEEVIPDA